MCLDRVRSEFRWGDALPSVRRRTARRAIEANEKLLRPAGRHPGPDRTPSGTSGRRRPNCPRLVSSATAIATGTRARGSASAHALAGPLPCRRSPSRCGRRHVPIADGPSITSATAHTGNSHRANRSRTSMSDAMRAETVQITGHRGVTTIEAYLAQPLDGPEPTGGVVVIHHMPGYDETDQGDHPEVRGPRATWPSAPTSTTREAPGASPDDAAAAARAHRRRARRPAGGRRGREPCRPSPVPRLSPTARVATIGYCSGGRQSFLAACSLEPRRRRRLLRGLRRRAPPPDGPSRSRFEPDREVWPPDLSCPLLGLFGAEDQYPSPEEVAELEKALTDCGQDLVRLPLLRRMPATPSSPANRTSATGRRRPTTAGRGSSSSSAAPSAPPAEQPRRRLSRTN
jgi:carboxymethylenebutenolidase